MSIKGIIFITFAVLGAILNFSANWVSARVKLSELILKVISLVIVLVSIMLLFIFGK